LKLLTSRSLFFATCVVLFRGAIPAAAQPATQNATSKVNNGLPEGMPDLQGVYSSRWITDLADPKVVEKAVDVPFTPWGKQVWDARQANNQRDDTTLQCLPDGLPRQAGTPYPMQIVQTPTQVVFLYEGAAHTFRVVPTDGRPHRLVFETFPMDAETSLVAIPSRAPFVFSTRPSNPANRLMR